MFSAVQNSDASDIQAHFRRRIMSSPSKKVVSSVTSFIAGNPSTLELMLASRKLTRQTKELTHGKPSAVNSVFNHAWDTLMASIITVLIGSLRIFLFFFFWGLLLMAIPILIGYL